MTDENQTQQSPSEPAPEPKPAPIPVREMRYVIACEQCKVEGVGTMEDYLAGQWVAVPGAQFGRDEPAWFCPSCTHGIRRV